MHRVCAKDRGGSELQVKELVCVVLGGMISVLRICIMWSKVVDYLWMPSFGSPSLISIIMITAVVAMIVPAIRDLLVVCVLVVVLWEDSFAIVMVRVAASWSPASSSTCTIISCVPGESWSVYVSVDGGRFMACCPSTARVIFVILEVPFSTAHFMDIVSFSRMAPCWGDSIVIFGGTIGEALDTSAMYSPPP